MHVGEGDVEEERVVGVFVDEFDGVVRQELGQALVLERLSNHGRTIVQETSLGARKFLVKLSMQ